MMLLLSLFPCLCSVSQYELNFRSPIFLLSRIRRWSLLLVITLLDILGWVITRLNGSSRKLFVKLVIIFLMNAWANVHHDFCLTFKLACFIALYISMFTSFSSCIILSGRDWSFILLQVCWFHRCPPWLDSSPRRTVIFKWGSCCTWFQSHNVYLL